MVVALLIYLADVIGSLKALLSGVILISFIALAVLGLYYFLTENSGYLSDEESINLAACKKWISNVAIVIMVAAGLSVIIPSKNTFYLMIGGYVAQSAYTEIKTSPLTDKINKIIQLRLDSELNNMLKEEADVTKEEGLQVENNSSKEGNNKNE